MREMRSDQLKLYSSVKEMPVEWLWYPYIPFGKLTLLQGDPGGGKSTLMMDIISAVSNGTALPDGSRLRKPMHVIYQCFEDGAADTIKPRLLRAGADCDNVAFIDEELFSVTLNDEKIRRAIADFNAKLLVIDPFQAYLGDADMYNAASVRKVLRQLGIWASTYDCAVVLIGHLNKKQGSKDLYRGLGSIDLVAMARSVMQVEREEDGEERTVHHIKSSLAPRGADLRFYIAENGGICWLGSEISAQEEDELQEDENMPSNKQERTAELLRSILEDGAVKASVIRSAFQGSGISDRTLFLTKKKMGVGSFRKNGSWYWFLRDGPDQYQEGEESKDE